MHSSSSEPIDSPSGFSWRADLLPATAAVILTSLLMLFPHLYPSRSAAPGVWVENEDELYYLEIAAHSYYNHPTRLDDPARPEGGPDKAQAPLYVPFVLAARLARAHPLTVSLLWRAWAGVGLGLGWYALAKRATRRPIASAALAVLMVCDIGVVSLGRPLVTQGTIVYYLWKFQFHIGSLVAPFRDILGGWRVINPGVSLPFLLLQSWLMLRARGAPGWGRVVPAGLATGLLFYIYIYYWTSAALAMAVGLALDRPGRRAYFHAGWIGCLVGSPPVVATFLLRQTASRDWLGRTGFLVPTFGRNYAGIPAVGLVVLAACLLYVLLRRRDLLYLWALALAGLVLACHHMVSGVEMQNFHYLKYVFRPFSAFLIFAIAVDAGGRLMGEKPLHALLLAVVAVEYSAGLALRYSMVVSPPPQYVHMREFLRLSAPSGSPPFAAGSVVAGEQSFVDCAVAAADLYPLYAASIAGSASIEDPEWVERLALNAALRGLSRREFDEGLRYYLKDLMIHSYWNFRAGAIAEIMGRCGAAFEEILADPSPAIDRYRVRYVAIPPAALRPATLGPDWELLSDGQAWRIWVRDVPRGPKGRSGMSEEGGRQSL